MLPFIILALLAILTKSPVAIAGLISYIIGLFGYIFWPQRTSGKSLNRSRRGASVAEGHFETTDHLQQDIAVRPSGHAIAGSGLVRRLVRAKDDPAKQRIRAQLSEIDDERLFGLGLTSEDIAALRGTASPRVEATIAQGVDAPSKTVALTRALHGAVQHERSSYANAARREDSQRASCRLLSRWQAHGRGACAACRTRVPKGDQLAQAPAADRLMAAACL
jgi:hypothetical protein